MDYSSTEETDITLMKPILKCLIVSDNKQLLNSNITLKLHPDTKLFRILQYMFEKYLSQNIISSNLNGLTIDQLCFKIFHSSNVLPLDISLDNIVNDYYHTNNLKNGEIMLCLEIKTDLDNYNFNDNPSMIDLDYNFATDFNYIDLDIQFNLLSTSNDYCTDPIVEFNKPKMPLDVKGENLRKIVLNDLIEVENMKNTLCSLNNRHTFNNIKKFKVKNLNLSAVDDNEVNNDKFLNSTLLEILGIDFIPDKTSKFSLMFYIQHKYNVSSKEKLINFVSDIPFLCHNKMIINDDTSIIAIKSYIIQTFLFRFNIDIPISDIILYFQNKRLVDIDLDGDEATIKQYIGTVGNPSILIQIPSIDSKQLCDKIDSFWYQNPDDPSSDCDCDSKSNKANENGYNISNIVNEDISSSQYEGGEVNYVFPESKLISDDEGEVVDTQESSNNNLSIERLQYKTESGHEIKILNGLYRKCIINGTEEAFIETKHFDKFQAKLRFSSDDSVNKSKMDEIHLSSMNQYKLHSSINRIELDDYIINELESKLNMCIVPEESINFTINTSNSIPSLLSSDISNENKIIRWLKIVLLFMVLICKTLYYVIVTNLMIFILLFELIFFISRKWIVSIISMIVLKTIFFNEIVRDSWIEYFRLDRYDENTLNKFQQFIGSNQLSDEFCLKLLSYNQNNETSNDSTSVLQKLVGYKEFNSLVDEIWTKYNIIRTGENFSLELLRGCKNKGNLRNCIRDFILLYIKELIQIDKDNSIVKNKRQFIKDMNELLYLVEEEVNIKEEENEDHIGGRRRRLRALMDGSIQRLRHANLGRQILEYIVPNPLRDSVFMCICKNIVLFVILLIPLVNIIVDDVISERRRLMEREEEQRRLRQEQEHVEQENEDNAISTGMEIHHIEED